jgi:hypothetical protein
MDDWLVYHPHYQALVCRVHGHAISNLASHLADKHKDIDVKSRNTIVAECSRLQLGRPSIELRFERFELESTFELLN